MQDFKKLKIWEKAIQIGILSHRFTASLPVNQKYALVDQINRCSISISSNIAEGSSRSSQKDYVRFIEISLGSAYELESQLIIANALDLGDSDLRNILLVNLNEVQKMLMSFRQALLKTKKPVSSLEASN
jgi:four helix bundle protein